MEIAGTTEWLISPANDWPNEVVESFQQIASVVGHVAGYRETMQYYELLAETHYDEQIARTVRRFGVECGSLGKHLFVSFPKKDPKRMACKNIKAPTIQVAYYELEKLGEGFAVTCPACKSGTLMGRRNEQTHEINEYDRCLLCGQVVQYLDITEIRREFGF